MVWDSGKKRLNMELSQRRLFAYTIFCRAQQPGLTGMKEGVICRFGELGVQFNNETIEFKPRLLRSNELLKQSEKAVCIYPDKSKRTITVPENALLFTITQIPVIYKRIESEDAEILVEYLDNSSETLLGDVLPQSIARSLLNLLLIYPLFMYLNHPLDFSYSSSNCIKFL